MSNNIQRLIDGEAPVHAESPAYTEEQLYWLMHEEGKRRFATECKHEKVNNGYCTECLRKVIDHLK